MRRLWVPLNFGVQYRMGLLLGLLLLAGTRADAGPVADASGSTDGGMFTDGGTLPGGGELEPMGCPEEGCEPTCGYRTWYRDLDGDGVGSSSSGTKWTNLCEVVGFSPYLRGVPIDERCRPARLT